MYIFTTLTTIACFLSLFLKKANDEPEENDSQVKDVKTVQVLEDNFDVAEKSVSTVINEEELTETDI